MNRSKNSYPWQSHKKSRTRGRILKDEVDTIVRGALYITGRPPFNTSGRGGGRAFMSGLMWTEVQRLLGSERTTNALCHAFRKWKTKDDLNGGSLWDNALRLAEDDGDDFFADLLQIQRELGLTQQSQQTQTSADRPGNISQQQQQRDTLSQGMGTDSNNEGVQRGGSSNNPGTMKMSLRHRAYTPHPSKREISDGRFVQSRNSSSSPESKRHCPPGRSVCRKTADAKDSQLQKSQVTKAVNEGAALKAKQNEEEPRLATENKANNGGLVKQNPPPSTIACTSTATELPVQPHEEIFLAGSLQPLLEKASSEAAVQISKQLSEIIATTSNVQDSPVQSAENNGEAEMQQSSNKSAMMGDFAQVEVNNNILQPKREIHNHFNITMHIYNNFYIDKPGSSSSSN